MSAIIEIRCPKCSEKIAVEADALADPILCASCGHEFTARQEGVATAPPMRRMGPGRAEMESVGQAKTDSGGAGFIVLMILIVLIAIILGFVNFWVAIAVGVIGLLAGILMQLVRIANKR